MATQEIRKSAVAFSGESRFHVGLIVGDLEKSISFYSKVFNQNPVKIRPGYAKYEPSFPPLNFTLNQASSAPKDRGVLSHMGIQLQDTGQLNQTLGRLKTAGLIKSIEDNVECCFAVQDKFWVEDPDGNALEFFVVLEKDAPLHSVPAKSGAKEVSAACCSG